MPSPFPPPPLEKINDPFIWRAFDTQDKLISASVNWDTSGKGEIMSMVLYRDPDCDFTQITIGTTVWEVPENETLVRIGALRSAGFFSIIDVFMADISAS